MLLSAVVMIIFGGQLVISGVSEGYCLVWPSIGTAYARGYTDSGYSRVKPGMTRDKVLSMLGEPLSRSFIRPAPPGMALYQRGDETWQYSQDSSARGGDWAWLSREIVFRGGVVVQKVEWTYHD